jgi:hypothetical protein
MNNTICEITPGKDLDDFPVCVVGFEDGDAPPACAVFESLRLMVRPEENRQRVRIAFNGMVPGRLDMSLDTARELRAALGRLLFELDGEVKSVGNIAVSLGDLDPSLVVVAAVGAGGQSVLVGLSGSQARELGTQFELLGKNAQQNARMIREFGHA